MARILVTGATGFIGKGILPRLVALGHDVVCLVRPNGSRPDPAISFVEIPVGVRELALELDRIRPDIVVHLASLFLASHTPEQAEELVSSNIAYPARLLESMKLAGTRKFLNTGSIFQSSDGIDGTPFNLYAATKQAFEDLLAHYARNEGFQVLTLRLADTYGPGDTRRKIIQLLMEAAIDGTPLDLSPGEQKLSLTWVDDVHLGFIHGIERLLSTTFSGHEIFGLCAQDTISIRQLAEAVERTVERRGDFRWGARSYRPNEIMEPTLPQPLPGWVPNTPLDRGLAELFASRVKMGET